ncbi:SDR family NAD(P)-dependent oxidoreductase [uncultured Gemmiger sp.]|uniref:SDR family NAD(P)-dependent oxidoreductase n=1 Tax=uncultured Gemmiger sp. TaxID=1623490 RepID=UPI0025FE7488|nr:SDR family NAD(P)-dependent oxidoreductase [uncultured Gemmiger sp.]
MLLQGKKAIVTGGTRGIGFAVVQTFLKNGASVALFGSRQETVDKALAALKAENPDWEVIGMAPDLTDYAAVDAAFAEVEKAFGRIDILVNNAGISAREPLYDYTPEAFENIMRLNVSAVFNGCRAAAPRMKAQGGGSIINTSSMVSLYGQPSGVGYPTSKFAVNGMTRSLARELGRDNIRVNAVAPGVTRTDMVANLPQEIVQRVCAPIPLGRMGEPEEVANAFLFLASDLASYITGEILQVDGAAQT